MRLFVAVEVPAPVQRALDDAVDAVRPLAPPGLRWSAPRRRHLTLAFLGEVDERAAGPLQERLARVAARHPSPRLRLAGAGRFDGRVLWARVDGDTDLLATLARSVAGAARHSGIGVEDRTYRPHVTVARTATTLDLRPLVSAMATLRTPDWQPPTLDLVRSRLGPDPEHTTLAASAFAPAGPGPRR